MEEAGVRARYEAALDEAVADLKRDKQVLAVALFGSLAYDVVWERSDIDLIVVVADQPGDDPGRGMLCYGGVNIHAQLATRAQFKRSVAGTMVGSAFSSIYETGRLLFSRDATIDALFEAAKTLGGRDRAIVMMRDACTTVPTLTKAQKWLTAKGDLEYASLFALGALQSIARIEIVRRGLNPNREVIQQALDVAPELVGPIYFDLLNKKKTKALVADRLQRIDSYLMDHQRELFGPLLDFLAERREPISAAEIEHHFARHFNVQGATMACEYLADNKVIEKTSMPVRLARKSQVEVEGLAFVHLPSNAR